MVESVEPPEAELLDGQHLDRAETGAFGVVGEDRPAHHRASAFRRRRRQAVGEADQRAVAVHRLLNRITRRSEIIGNGLVHDHDQTIGPDGLVDRCQYVDRARHVVDALEREGSIERPELAQRLALRDAKGGTISYPGGFSVGICRLNRRRVDIDTERRPPRGRRVPAR